jgi:sugar phosphate isomerase/epimerase
MLARVVGVASIAFGIRVNAAAHFLLVQIGRWLAQEQFALARIIPLYTARVIPHTHVPGGECDSLAHQRLCRSGQCHRRIGGCLSVLLTRNRSHMLELSMNEVTTFRWSLEEDIEKYRRAGYRSIGVWRHKLTDLDEEQAIDLLADSGLTVSNLACAGGFTGLGGTSFREGVEDAVDALRVAAAMRARCLVIYPGGRNNHTSRHALRLLRAALDELLPLADDCEVPLALEPMHVACAAGWTFLTDFELVCELISEYSSPYLKLACDTYHFPWSQTDRDVLGDIAEHIGIVYLADRKQPPSIDHERCLLGRGQLPLADIVATLIESGYSGPFDVRLMGTEIEQNDYGLLLEQSQWAFAELVQASTTRSLA